MNKIKDSHDWHTVLFPHSYLREQDIKKIFPLLGPITICQPWFMVPPDFMSQKGHQGVVRVLNPSSHLKPEENFKGLLSEYKTWIKHIRDKSSVSFFKVSQEKRPAEDNTWEIRESLRESARARGGSDKPKQEREEPFSLKWHLILHLARDMEKERQEADRMLRGLKEGKSPIADLLGEGAVKNPLTDLSQFESDPQTVSYPIDQVFDAWFGLFGEYIKGDELLITLSRQVMDYASEAWDTSVKERRREDAPLIRFKYPDLSDYYSGDELVGLGKKTFRDDRFMKLRNLIRDLGKGHKVDLSGLREHAKEVETIYQESSEKAIHITVKDFSPFSKQPMLEDNGAAKYLSGKTMILVEEETHSE